MSITEIEGPSQVQPEGEIKGEMSRIENAIKSVDRAIDRLIENLSPILEDQTENTGVVEEAKDSSCLSPMGRDLKIRREAIFYLEEKINKLNTRIRL